LGGEPLPVLGDDVEVVEERLVVHALGAVVEQGGV
jgi:hypothetical protein